MKTSFFQYLLLCKVKLLQLCRSVATNIVVVLMIQHYMLLWLEDRVSIGESKAKKEIKAKTWHAFSVCKVIALCHPPIPTRT
jgi:hypothetical protein